MRQSKFVPCYFQWWPTTYRMRFCEPIRPVLPCLLGCSVTAVDKLEHYAVCTKLWDLFCLPFPSGFGFREESRTLDTFFCVRPGMTKREKLCMIIGVRAATKAILSVRKGDVISLIEYLLLEAEAVGFPECLENV